MKNKLVCLAIFSMISLGSTYAADTTAAKSAAAVAAVADKSQPAPTAQEVPAKSASELIDSLTEQLTTIVEQERKKNNGQLSMHTNMALNMHINTLYHCKPSALALMLNYHTSQQREVHIYLESEKEDGYKRTAEEIEREKYVAQVNHCLAGALKDNKEDK